jgi:hypothetical protein
MAEVLGPLGIALGGLSFIFGTAPAAAKFFSNFRDKRQQNSEYRHRVQVCKTKYVLWEKYWKLAKPEEDEDYYTVAGMEDLANTIDENIRNHVSSRLERQAWETMKVSSRQGTFRLPRDYTEHFCERLRFALWKKEILEGWLNRLEKAVAATVRIYEDHFHAQTAYHFTGSVSLAQSKNMADLGLLFGTLESLATDLHNECIGASASHLTPPGVYKWALGLRPPTTGHRILDWTLPTPVTIELHATVTREPGDIEELHLNVRYQPDNDDTYATNGRLTHLLRMNACRKNSDEKLEPVTNAEYHDQLESTRRTLSMGTLLIHNPHLFKGTGWLLERAQLVHVISEWTLLLWNTPWFSHLCCQSLDIEIDACTSDCARHVLRVQQPHDCRPQDHSSRLKNLGLVLAQLILAVPLRPADGGNPSKYEQCVKGRWEPVYLTDLNTSINAATLSLPVSEAIYFCLKPEPELPDNDFKIGYLYMCMARIYTPLVAKFLIVDLKADQSPVY